MISQMEYYPHARPLNDGPDFFPKPPIESSLKIEKLIPVLAKVKKESAIILDSGTVMSFTNALSVLNFRKRYHRTKVDYFSHPLRPYAENEKRVTKIESGMSSLVEINFMADNFRFEQKKCHNKTVQKSN